MKVLLGMSGGVDSSVAAHLLVEAGHDVVGVFMKNWEGDECEWAQDSADAMIVAQELGIPYRVIDFQEEYKDKILDYMIAEYKAGRTPNPDVYCNRHIKFGHFYNAFESMGFDAVATGHYASTDGEFIYKGVDPTKDQSYFLSNVKKDMISKMMLPLGKFTKAEIREMARERGIVTADKKDSQGLCFIGNIDFQEFLSRYIPDSIGNIIDASTMDIVGTHKGIHHHTIGQRKGLAIEKPGPWFVSHLDKDSNTVYVRHVDFKDEIYRNSFQITDTTWYTDSSPEDLMEVVVRYHDKPMRCVYNGDWVHLMSGFSAIIAPGQVAAFYRGDKLIGSGIITL